MLMHKKSDYMKIFYSVALAVFITGLVLSVSLYVNFNRILSEKVQSYTADQLNQIRFSTDQMFENAKYTIMEYYSDPNVMKLLNYTNISDIDTYSLLSQINVNNSNMQYQNYIYLYNKTDNSIYFQLNKFDISNFPDSDIITRLNASESTQKLFPIPRKVPSYLNFVAGGTMEEVYTFIYYNGKPDMINNAIILNMSPKLIKDSIDSMNSDISKEIIITDAKGNVVLGNNSYKFMENISNTRAFQSIFTANRDSGYNISTIDNRKYFISYISSDVLDWKYIRITPYSTISKGILSSLFTSLIICFCVLLLAFYMVLFISRNIYRFHKSSLDEIQKKYALEKKSIYERKQQLLKNSFTQRINDPEKFKLGLKQVGINFELEKPFNLVLYKIDQYQDFCNMYSAEDRELFSYGFINIIDELSKSDFCHETIDLGNGLFLLVLNSELDQYQDCSAELRDMVMNTQNKVRTYLNASLSAVIGSVLEDYSEIYESLSECMNSMNYKIFIGKQAIIDVMSTREIQKKEFKIPGNTIGVLTDLLFLCKKDEAMAAYKEIIDYVQGYSFTSFQITILNIIIEIKDKLEKQGISGNALNMYDYYNLLKEMPDFDFTDSVDQQISELFDAIIKELQEHSYNRNNRISKRIKDIQNLIDQEYSNPNLTPEIIAQKLHVSPEYLKKVFKNSIGKSLSEFINQYRLEKAKEFMLNSTDSAYEIAEKCGFSNINYFYTMFKKSYGVTANEYRSLSRPMG